MNANVFTLRIVPYAPRTLPGLRVHTLVLQYPSMQIEEEALTEFIKLFEEEFKERIELDKALIMARNLVMFYEYLHEKGIAYAAEESFIDDGPSAEPEGK